MPHLLAPVSPALFCVLATASAFWCIDFGSIAPLIFSCRAQYHWCLFPCVSPFSRPTWLHTAAAGLGRQRLGCDLACAFFSSYLSLSLLSAIAFCNTCTSKTEQRQSHPTGSVCSGVYSSWRLGIREPEKLKWFWQQRGDIGTSRGSRVAWSVFQTSVKEKELLVYCWHKGPKFFWSYVLIFAGSFYPCQFTILWVVFCETPGIWWF